jgi:hypothetical protein
MEMSIGELILWTLLIIVPCSFIAAFVETAAEQRKREKEWKRARELQGKVK